MAQVKFKRGLSDNLPETIADGVIYFATDTGKLYIDIAGNERLEINPNSDWNASSGNAAIANKPTGATVVKTISTVDAGSTVPAGDLSYWSFNDNVLELKHIGYTSGNALN